MSSKNMLVYLPGPTQSEAAEPIDQGVTGPNDSRADFLSFWRAAALFETAETYPGLAKHGAAPSVNRCSRVGSTGQRAWECPASAREVLEQRSTVVSLQVPPGGGVCAWQAPAWASRSDVK